MSEYTPSAALLRTRIVVRATKPEDDNFANGFGTRGATHAYLKQAASRVAGKVVAAVARLKPTSEERRKDIERRRKWAGGGSMPPAVRAFYSEAERAALSVIAEQCKRKDFCGLCIDEIARLAGVSRTTVQNAVRKARSPERGHISVRERPQERGKSLTNIIKIVCSVWVAWIKRAIGFKRLNTSETPVRISLSEQVERPEMAFERKNADSSVYNRKGCISGDLGNVMSYSARAQAAGTARLGSEKKQQGWRPWG